MKKTLKMIAVMMVMVLLTGTFGVAGTAKAASEPCLFYRVHQANRGWLPFVYHGFSGYKGESNAIEMVELHLQGMSGSVILEVHVAGRGWLPAATGRDLACGTTGEGRQMEGLKARLTGEVAREYSIYYRAHCQNIGDQEWKHDGELAGTTGQALRMESIEFKLVKKNASSDTTSDVSNISGFLAPLKGGMQITGSSCTTHSFKSDFKASYQNLYAPGDGTVEFRQTYSTRNHKLTSYGSWVRWTSTDGKTVVIMAHLSSFNGVSLRYTSNYGYPCSSSRVASRTVTLGTRKVTKGELIGVSGSSGNSSAPHCHIEVTQSGVSKNPATFFTQWN